MQISITIQDLSCFVKNPDLVGSLSFFFFFTLLPLLVIPVGKLKLVSAFAMNPNSWVNKEPRPYLGSTGFIITNAVGFWFFENLDSKGKKEGK